MTFDPTDRTPGVPRSLDHRSGSPAEVKGQDPEPPDGCS